MISVLLWTFYFYIFNVQRTETVSIFSNLLTPPATWYTKFQPHVTSKTCMLIPEHGPCRDTIPMWFFDPQNKTCAKFDWGGCQGNGNRFDSLVGCLGFCLSKPGSTNRPRYCSLTFDYGFCFGAAKRWYYDSKWKVCKSTIYSGCGGNKNNFYGKEQCDQVCRFGHAPISGTTRDMVGAKKVLIINPNPTSPRTETVITDVTEPGGSSSRAA